MKKIERFIFILILIISCLPVHSQTGVRPRGDVDCDWRVTINDVSVIIDSILCHTKYHSFYNYACDINGDKRINIADAIMIIDALLGQELPPMPSYSGTMPVLFINTEGYRNIDSKEEYLHADWWLDNMGIEGYESIGSSDNPQSMQIKGRGNYSWTLTKKSFRIKLDEKQPILGMNSNRHFCLLAHADDHYAKLKNTMGFELSRRIGLAYTPEQKPVEVVLNGQYIGLYFVADKIRVGKDRVNIEEQQDNETDPSIITGGWLLEIDNNEDENTLVFQETNTGHWYDRLWITPHSPEVLSDEQREYIRNFIETTNAAIYNPDKTSTDWENYIDLDSLVSFYLIGEIMDDIEYFDGSCFMHKHRGDSTKLIFGPVWDFGNSFMRRNFYPELTNYNYFLYQQPCYFYNNWIGEIAKYPKFKLAVIKRWREFYTSGFNGLNINQFIKDFLNNIRGAIQYDSNRWSYIELDYEAALFKHHLNSKITWLESKWGINANIDIDGQEIHP